MIWPLTSAAKGRSCCLWVTGEPCGRTVCSSVAAAAVLHRQVDRPLQAVLAVLALLLVEDLR